MQASVYEEIKRSKYRQRMYGQGATHAAWKCARRFSSSSYGDVDRYLQEKNGLEYALI